MTYFQQSERSLLLLLLGTRALCNGVNANPTNLRMQVPC
jgi:hypothetical protein